MNALLQVGSSGRAPASPEKRFFINLNLFPGCAGFV